ncbi:hypothetical protein BDFB_000472 [Asbolus verrucosus]|uniref:Uncharacterized protein n=1 Tax=Asbolus verrucosus TaxID=1661398 RepID=A0A482VVU3_ASBVE|nr:hypothetical protein BDFB_000472 [Asbolus verrucosus]
MKRTKGKTGRYKGEIFVFLTLYRRCKGQLEMSTLHEDDLGLLFWTTTLTVSSSRTTTNPMTIYSILKPSIKNA